MSFSITHLDIHCSPGNYGFKPVQRVCKGGGTGSAARLCASRRLWRQDNSCLGTGIKPNGKTLPWWGLGRPRPDRAL